MLPLDAGGGGGIDAAGGGGVSLETAVVDKVILSRSIMFCSCVVLVGAGGSDRTNALLGTDVEATDVDGDGSMPTNAKPSLAPPGVLSVGPEDLCLECLHSIEQATIRNEIQQIEIYQRMYIHST